MTQVFKVLKPFEFENREVMLGEEIVCRAREAEPLMQNGFITTSDRELDPADKKDAELIAKSDKRAQDRHADIVAGEASKDMARDERETANDAAKVAEAAPAPTPEAPVKTAAPKKRAAKKVT